MDEPGAIGLYGAVPVVVVVKDAARVLHPADSETAFWGFVVTRLVLASGIPARGDRVGGDGVSLRVEDAERERPFVHHQDMPVGRASGGRSDRCAGKRLEGARKDSRQTERPEALGDDTHPAPKAYV